MIFMDKISIIIYCYNKESCIEKMLNFFLNQIHKDIEIICINDGSADNSPKIIREYADKYRKILFFDEKVHRGIPYVKNMVQGLCSEKNIFIDVGVDIDQDRVQKALDANKW